MPFGEQYRLWSDSLYKFIQPSETSPLSGPNILLNALFSNTKGTVLIKYTISFSTDTKTNVVGVCGVVYIMK
jgi:hypothetical protein